ncbi:PASTA domain-containing protein [Actinoplanes sp. NPDC023801]|uniref:PASTA domain-containing protein n=1 Tax=Actinoplanes sp. NPDC023801 TaxID=3154595 RepID=UPI0033D44BF3
MPRGTAAAVLAAVILSGAGCGSPDTAPERAPEGDPVVAPATTTPAAATPAPGAAKIEVPRGVGLDYQSAQDLWRAAGLHVAPAKDATGANRIPVIDANWVVVSQEPKAGATVDAGSFITATVKKDTDP